MEADSVDSLFNWSKFANALPSVHTDVGHVTSTARVMVGRSALRSHRRRKAKRQGALIKHGSIHQGFMKPSISRLLQQNKRLRRTVRKLKKKLRFAKR